MFGLFKKADPVQKLLKKHKELLSESHRLSHSDRKTADAKFAEAEEIAKQIDELRKTQ